MPRVYFDYRDQGRDEEGGDPIDLCVSCYRAAFQEKAKHDHINKAAAAGKARGLTIAEGDDHPDYEDTDYICEDCGGKLTSRDN